MPPPNPQVVIPREVDEIGSAEAARILGTTVASVCRYTATGYLPTLRKVPGAGHGGHIYNRSVVTALAEKRATAARVLDWRSSAWIETQS